MKISIIICTYRRINCLIALLESLFSQSNIESTSVEIVIVDNDEYSINIENTIRNLFLKGVPSNYSLVYIKENIVGLSQARNSGVNVSTGSYLIFIDDDCLAEQYYLSEFIDGFNKFEKGIVFSGSVDLSTEYLTQIEDIPKWSYFVFGYQILSGTHPRVIIADETIKGGNFAIKKTAFDTIGLFRTDYGHTGTNMGGGEENELFDRIKVSYSCDQLIACPKAKVTHRFDRSRLNKEYVLERLRVNGRVRAKIFLENKKYISYLIRYIYFCLIIVVSRKDLYKCAEGKGFLSYSWLAFKE